MQVTFPPARALGLCGAGCASLSPPRGSGKKPQFLWLPRGGARLSGIAARGAARRGRHLLAALDDAPRSVAPQRLQPRLQPRRGAGRCVTRRRADFGSIACLALGWPA